MKSDLSKVKVWDRIWTIQEGWTEVNKKSLNFIKTRGRNEYYLDGRQIFDDQHPSAFLTNPFEVDEAFIKEAYSEACDKWKIKIKEKYPDVFKSELEIGKWYNSTIADALYFIKEKTKFGFNTYGIVGKEWCIDEIIHHLDKLELATEQEVSEALINEAKKRGFKDGVIFNSPNAIYNHSKNQEIKCCYFSYSILYNMLSVKQTSKNAEGIIFKNGTWAEIIPNKIELTLEQIADKFGVDVNNLKIKK